MLNYEKLIVGEMRTNCYLVWDDEKNAVVIDPGDEAEFISEEIERRHLKLIGILLTHKHFDHVGALKYLQLIYNVPIIDTAFDLEIIKTPGHTADSVCFFSPTLGVVFTGDTLFKELPTRNENIDSVRKLFDLPEETIVLAGHDEDTTLAAEARRYHF